MYHGYMNDSEEASEMMKRGGLPSDHIWHAISSLFRAEVKTAYGYHDYKNLGNSTWDRAEFMYRSILPKFQRHFGPTGYWVGRTLLHWGEVSRRGVDPDVVRRAERRIEEALAIER